MVTLNKTEHTDKRICAYN